MKSTMSPVHSMKKRMASRSSKSKISTAFPEVSNCGPIRPQIGHQQQHPKPPQCVTPPSLPCTLAEVHSERSPLLTNKFHGFSYDLMPNNEMGIATITSISSSMEVPYSSVSCWEQSVSCCVDSEQADQQAARILCDLSRHSCNYVLGDTGLGLSHKGQQEKQWEEPANVPTQLLKAEYMAKEPDEVAVANKVEVVVPETSITPKTPKRSHCSTQQSPSNPSNIPPAPKRFRPARGTDVKCMNDRPLEIGSTRLGKDSSKAKRATVTRILKKKKGNTSPIRRSNTDCEARPQKQNAELQKEQTPENASKFLSKNKKIGRNGPIAKEQDEDTDTLLTFQELNANDVLMGRGNAIAAYSGNKRYRDIIKRFRPAYMNSYRYEKRLISQQVVTLVTSLGGRFLEEVPGRAKGIENSLFRPVLLERALEKISQACREKSP